MSACQSQSHHSSKNTATGMTAKPELMWWWWREFLWIKSCLGDGDGDTNWCDLDANKTLRAGRYNHGHAGAGSTLHLETQSRTTLLHLSLWKFHHLCRRRDNAFRSTSHIQFDASQVSKRKSGWMSKRQKSIPTTATNATQIFIDIQFRAIHRGCHSDWLS